MGTVSVSPKFQVVIPNTIRETLGLVSGQKMQAMRFGDRVELIADFEGVTRGRFVTKRLAP